MNTDPAAPREALVQTEALLDARQRSFEPPSRVDAVERRRRLDTYEEPEPEEHLERALAQLDRRDSRRAWEAPR